MPLPGERAIDTAPIQELLRRIRERYQPHQVWLFGSRARGDARPRSDWDLLVVVPDDLPEEALDPIAAFRLQRKSGVYADVIPVRRSDFEECRNTVNTLSYVAAHEGVQVDVR